MSISSDPLSYCTNVHPGRSVAEVLDGLDRYTVAVQQRVGHPIAAGLWLAQPVVNELLQRSGGPQWFAEQLQRRGLLCYTLNAFPFGDFHSTRVKENVYQPDWSTIERLEYTKSCATVLAALLPPNGEGSISTLPLGFKASVRLAGFVELCSERLLECARFLDALHRETGKLVRVAIEPEPLCLLETTAEAIRFFRRLFDAADRAGIGEMARHHLGVCYDICHQAVEFEEPAECVAALQAAGVRINKVHISCALQLDAPATNSIGRAALKKFVEPRYLHQVIARAADGQLHRRVDLDQVFIDAPPAEFLNAQAWRIHFHVPISAKNMGELGSTQFALKPALAAIAALDYAPHLEVETYTWNVLPGVRADLVGGLSEELVEAHRMVSNLARSS
jgi:sugar phosphate isomerase/epimerase